MVYKVSATEKLRKSCAVTETKALLYLMNFHEEKDEIYYFVIDLFNDLTGMDNMSDRLWDVQSKGASNSSPKAVGRELVTLYKNYVSDLKFDNFILFMGGVSDTVRKDSSKNIFDISNVQEKALKKMKEGLIDECNEKTYIFESDINSEKIDDFLKAVLFVVDDKEPYEYVKAIIDSQVSIIPNNVELTGIFNEIRDTQSAKKNGKNIEGISISSIDESLNYLRHLTSSEIKTFVVGRIINRNPFAKGCPVPFIDIYQKFPEEKREEALENCKLDMSRALFDRTNYDGFWKLFSEVCNKLVMYPKKDINEIFSILDPESKKGCPHFDVLSLKYFIATVKEGIKQ
ncbi:TPA: hypothetical protein ACOBUB_002153 [Enterococcus faecium]